MAYTLNQTLTWASPYIEYSPLTAASPAGEPALTIATMTASAIMNPPLTFPWNRNEFAITLTQGVQDYVFPLTDFAYLEKVSLLTADGTYGFELSDVYNTNTLGIPTTGTGAQAQPNAASVKFYIPGTSVAIRFLSIPDQAYTGVLTYQKIPPVFTALTQNWNPIPDWFSEVYNNLFLAEAMDVVDDARAVKFRQRGIAALLAKSEGLSQLQINAFLAQWTSRGVGQEQLATLRNQQAQQARGV